IGAVPVAATVCIIRIMVAVVAVVAVGVRGRTLGIIGRVAGGGHVALCRPVGRGGSGVGVVLSIVL
ncbi:MAG TPA: hypothetical protein VF914_17115, partial [Chloroflexia bacterium]